MSDSIEKNKEQVSLLGKLLCFTLTAGIIIADQVTKLIVSMLLPIHKSVDVLGELVRITHVRNLDGLFSLGQGWSAIAKQVVFLWIPILVICFVIYLIILSKDVTRGQRWILAAICGGGIGNIIDRLARPDGVIDFINVKFFGIFGLERWPTFNVADSTIVVCAILLLVSIVYTEIKKKKRGVTKASNE